MTPDEIIKAQTNEIERLNMVLLDMAARIDNLTERNRELIAQMENGLRSFHDLRGAIEMVLNCPDNWSLKNVRAELKDMLPNDDK